MKELLQPLLYAGLEFLFSALIVCLTSLSIFADIFLFDGHIGETTSVELLQALLLAMSIFFFFREAFRKPEYRSGFILAGGFLLCMLIREMDAALDLIRHGLWAYAAGGAALVCITLSLHNPRTALQGLNAIVTHRAYGTLSSGMLCVLCFSRLFGMGVLWEQIMGDNYDRWLKDAIEEGCELFGYTLTFLAALRYAGIPRFGRRKRESTAQAVE